ncbi:MAG: glycoside hydrolase family 127 protein [Verrucomicrobia subdivision 3 bacterium]|nr:glycoside hydrolase family 127 protein [Limisphaerales bacterium]
MKTDRDFWGNLPYLAAVLAVWGLVCRCVAAPLPRDYAIRPVLFTSVKVADDFWSPRLETNRVATVAACFKRCEETGRIDNFAKAGGLVSGDFKGIRYDDSDVFKVIEGAAYTLEVTPDEKLEKYLDDLIAKIAAAQEPDGYLYTARTVKSSKPVRDIGSERWSFLKESHELYNVGHMYEAAVAYFLATGKRSLLEVAIKNANLIASTFGPDKRRDVPGHEEIEIGLVKLYRVTGDERYLKLAKFFIDERGRGNRPKYGEYAQDHKPVVEQREPAGHAVRACYLYSGIADMAALTGEQSYVAALNRIWQDLVSSRLYLTGGIGAEAGHEGFGPPYHLPNRTAYNETCAAVGLALWNHRMFLLHGDSKYIDVLERVIYNGFLSGVGLEGDKFFYPNPLACDVKQKFNHGSLTRSPWFGTACCPVNIVRFLPSIAGYIYANTDDAVYVNLFVGGVATMAMRGETLKLTQSTRYPWDGRVKIGVDTESPAEFSLHVRIPGWSLGRPVPSELYNYEKPLGDRPTLRVNGRTVEIKPENGYARVKRTWKKGDTVELDLPMPVQRVVAHENVKENTGRIALERGPIVYCVEAVDHASKLSEITLPETAKLKPDFRKKLLGGVTILTGKASAAGKPVEFTAIPYYAWNHRGPGEMEVWLRAK